MFFRFGQKTLQFKSDANRAIEYCHQLVYQFMIGEEYRSNITHYMLNGTLCVHCCRRNRLRLDLVILCLRLHPSQNNMTCLWSVILRKMPECQQTAREIRMEMDSPESLQKVCMLLCQSENSHSQVTFTIIKRDFKGRDILGNVILCLDCYLILYQHKH